MKASFSCVELDGSKSLFKISQITSRQHSKRELIQQDVNQQKKIEKYSGEEQEKSILIVSLVLEKEFIESTRRYSYVKRPSCATKKDLCSENRFIDYCHQNKVSLVDGFVSEGKQRVYLIPPLAKVGECFVESACCPYISIGGSSTSSTEGICLVKLQPEENENKQCDDKNVCTYDRYDSQKGRCVFTPIVCDDEDACTIDNCHPELGCVFNVLSCDDNDPCTTDSCDVIKGCIHTPVKCDDGDACTVDNCDKQKGCVFKDLSCDDNDPCTTDSCDVVKGCIHTTVNCDDGDPCTSDQCNSVSGKCESNKINSPECSSYFATPTKTDCDKPTKLYSSSCDESLTFDRATGACYGTQIAKQVSGNKLGGQMLPNVFLKSFNVTLIPFPNSTITSVDWSITSGCSDSEFTICSKIGAPTVCTFLETQDVINFFSCYIKVDPICDLRTGGPYFLNLFNAAANNLVFWTSVRFDDPTSGGGCGCTYDSELLQLDYVTYSLTIN